MKKFILASTASLAALWVLLTIIAGCWWLPPMLLQATAPVRNETQRQAVRDALCPGDAHWQCREVVGGANQPLQVWRLHRPNPRGVVILLHGFGDDAWGIAPLLERFPQLDPVVFSFRGRDQHPNAACTLGGWERADLLAVVAQLGSEGVSRSRIVLAGCSQGAGVALLALNDLEANGGPLGGALLESPFASLEAAARDHLRGSLGSAEWLLRPAEKLALAVAGRQEGFDPWAVSPLQASAALRTPVALLAGDRDTVTPLAEIQAMARRHPDLTVVAGAGHGEAEGLVPGGYSAWAQARLQRWGFASN